MEFCQEASKLRRKFATASGFGFCDYVKDLYVALFNVRLGEFDAAFQSLKKAYTKHEAELIYLNVTRNGMPFVPTLASKASSFA